MPTGKYKRKSKSGIPGNIPGYENYYVTRCGRVFSLFQNKFLMATINTNGYSIVCLSKNNRKKIMRVHRLVALVYIKKPRRSLEVNHGDGNKQNNKVSNLEWCTRSENMRHAYKTGLRGKK